MNKNRWVFVPIKLNDKVILYQLSLDNTHFGRNGYIELALENIYEKLLTKQKVRGYII